MSDNKDRLTYRPEPETKQKIERWYQEDNCRSKNEFIEKAVNCYADSCVPPIHLLYGCNTHKSNKKLGGEKISHCPAFC